MTRLTLAGLAVALACAGACSDESDTTPTPTGAPTGGAGTGPGGTGGMATGGGGAGGTPACLPDAGGTGPFICSVAGAATESATVTVAGVHFGTHDLAVQWLGGAAGNIEMGTAGQPLSATGWSVDPDSGGFTSPVYDDSRAHSGQQSIYAVISDGKWASGFTYTHPDDIAELYVSWWVYFQPAPGEGGQWKLWRLRAEPSVNDSMGEIYVNNWYETDHTHTQQMILLHCCDVSGCYFDCYPGQDGGLRWMGSEGAVEAGQWTRLEYHAIESTAPGARDGSFAYHVHKQSSPVHEEIRWEGNIITRNTGVPNRWRRVVFQNYWGNGNADNAEMWFDDVYVQIGTPARVELADSATWSEHQHREVQPATAWADGQITIELSRGSFTAGETAYLFVVDHDGRVSNGYPVTLE